MIRSAIVVGLLGCVLLAPMFAADVLEFRKVDYFEVVVKAER